MAIITPPATGLTKPNMAQISTNALTLEFNDPVMLLNAGETGANTGDIGFVFDRGTDANVAIMWDESADAFVCASTTSSGTEDGNVTISAYSNLQAGTITENGTALASKYLGISAPVADSSNLDGQLPSYYLDWTNTTNKPDPVITLGGDLTGNVTLTNLSNGTLTATVVNDSHTHATQYLGLTAKAADSELLDNLNSTQFLRSDTSDTINGNLSVTGDLIFTDTVGDIRNTATGVSPIIDMDFSESTLNLSIRYMRDTNSTGSRSSIWYAGDGTASTAMQLNHGSKILYINGNQVWHAGNDGAGSGLDADTLDGVEGANFLRSNVDDTFSGKYTGNTLTLGGSDISASSAKFQVNGFSRMGSIYLHEGTSPTTNSLLLENNTGALRWNSNQVWHAGNDGAGSGLDADLLDGTQGSGYARYEAGGTLANSLADAAWVTSYGGVSNIDHVWHDDTGGVFHFCTDATWKANGNATVRAGAFNENGTALSAKYLGVSATAAAATKLATARTIDITGDITATAVAFDGTSNIAISASVNNDSHTHATQYLGLTAKAADSEKLDNIDSSGFARANASTSGFISSTSNIISGSGSGGVAMTINDGYGNANLTFNHTNGVPEQAGASGRIEVNTDSVAAGAASMSFELKSAVSSGVAVACAPILILSDTSATVHKNLLPSATTSFNVGSDAARFSTMYATTFNEAGTALSSKYLGITAKAADSDKLDNLNSTQFLRSDADDTFAGELTIQHNLASPVYHTGQLELQTTDGSDASLGFHRSGFTACQLRHESNGLILSGSARTTNANFSILGGTMTAGLFSGTATSARYADLAENYEADMIIEPGTVVMIGGTKEVTTCTVDHSPAMVGIVSTDPAHLMNSMQEGEFVAAVALTGRVPCKVIGHVPRGSLMVSAGNGCARAEVSPNPGTIIGKALTEHTGPEEGIIEVIVGKH